MAESHGGNVFAWTRSGGGVSVGFTVSGSLLLPDSAPDSAEPLQAARSGVPTAPGDVEAGQEQSPRTPRSSSPARPG
ncbi:hypothetical protein [Streptomyces tendae]|uniref:hypothetical protein n=1 Tax=Streptomyces tendae TaxID=1932 RepID=UPI0036498AA5